MAEGADGEVSLKEASRHGPCAVASEEPAGRLGEERGLKECISLVICRESSETAEARCGALTDTVKDAMSDDTRSDLRAWYDRAFCEPTVGGIYASL